MRRTLSILVWGLLSTCCLCAQTPLFIGMGDSLGEGVQSIDAAVQTQPNVYLNLIAGQMNVPFILPLIKTGPFSVYENVRGRSRIDPSALANNLAVSGADSTSILTEQVGSPIATETDLVLSPRTGTQMSIAESLHPSFIICWIGSNDLLGAVTNFHQLDASQITPLAVFDSNYDQISSRLGALGARVVFATIPDVTQIAFLFSPQDLVTFLGSDYGLPQGSYTTLPAMLLIKLGINDGSILQNPNWVLDAAEIQTIHNAATAFSQSIKTHAGQINADVLDVNTLFSELNQNPPVFGPITLSGRYLGGLFSLDGAHPSDIGHALIANAFISEMDSYFNLSIPQIGTQDLWKILLADPFVDFNHNLKVRGRPGVGLLETLGPFLGISGDRVFSPGVDKAAGQRFMQQYMIVKGKDPNTTWNQDDAIAAFEDIFRFRK
jgi:phospholipase/lecithinase/hemolysin